MDLLSLTTSTMSSLLLLCLLTTTTTTSSLPSSIGFTYVPTPTTPSPSHVASTLHSLGISSVRLPNPSPDTIRAFSYTNISLLLSLPNSLIPFLSNNLSNAHLFLSTHVLPFHPRSKISTISLGHDPLLHPDPELPSLLLPALRNLHISLRNLGIKDISVSTTLSFLHVLTTAFPPSSAEFQPPAADVIVKPLLSFLRQTNSSFLVNLRPYDVYKAKPEIPVGFALFRETPFNFRDDVATGVRYRNLFDAMVDAVVAAMAAAGHTNIPVMVTETGWPSGQAVGGGDDPDATEAFAGMYVNGLIEHVKSGLGTPLRKEGVAQAYVYELFDSDEEIINGTETGPGPGPYYGILYPNMTKKVDVDFSAASERMGLGLGLGGGGRFVVGMAVRVLMGRLSCGFGTVAIISFVLGC